MIKVTCALIVDEQDRLFAAQRSGNMKLPFKWEFPGGKVEHDETPESCLIREIKEELDIEVAIIGTLPFNEHVYPFATIRLIPFICRKTFGEIKLNEHIKYKWLNRNELLDLDWAEADIPILNHYLRT